MSQIYFLLGIYEFYNKHLIRLFIDLNYQMIYLLKIKLFSGTIDSKKAILSLITRIT